MSGNYTRTYALVYPHRGVVHTSVVGLMRVDNSLGDDIGLHPVIDLAQGALVCGEDMSAGDALYLDPRAYVFVQTGDGWYCEYAPYKESGEPKAISDNLRWWLAENRDTWTMAEARRLLRLKERVPSQNGRPWMVAIEMQFAAMRLLRAHPSSDAMRAGLEIKHLQSASAYDWATDPLIAVALASRSIPGSTLLGDVALNEHAGWWWFGLNRAVPAAALLWARSRDGVLLSWYELENNDSPWSRFVWGWAFGDSLATMLAAIVAETKDEGRLREELDHVEVLSRFFLAGCAWLNQKVAVTGIGHVERHRRKQLAREHDAPLPSDVKVVQLRRTESRPYESGCRGESADWSCRWIVNGHWRNQAYKNKRELIYIMPYVKGPDDKPLKVPNHTVYQVSR